MAIAKHTRTSAGRREGQLIGEEWLILVVDDGVNTDETIGISGIDVGDRIIAVTDLTLLTSVDKDSFEVTGPGVVTYTGLIDRTLSKLQIFWTKYN